MAHMELSGPYHFRMGKSKAKCGHVETHENVLRVVPEHVPPIGDIEASATACVSSRAMARSRSNRGIGFLQSYSERLFSIAPGYGKTYSINNGRGERSVSLID